MYAHTFKYTNHIFLNFDKSGAHFERKKKRNDWPNVNVEMNLLLDFDSFTHLTSERSPSEFTWDFMIILYLFHIHKKYFYLLLIIITLRLLFSPLTVSYGGLET